MANREDPLVAFKFALEIEGKLSGYFTNVTGIGSETEVIEQKVTGENGETMVQKIPGRHLWTEITLKRGVTTNLDIWNWRKLVVDGKVGDARTNCSIIALAQDNAETARWNFTNAWPSKVSGPEMNSSGANYMVEEITIVHEGLERVS